MNLVDEQHVARLEVGEHGREVAGTLEGRAGGHPEAGPDLIGEDSRQRGLSQARRTGEEHVVDGFAAFASRLDENAEPLLECRLSDELVHATGAKRDVVRLLLGEHLGGEQALLSHIASLMWRPSRTFPACPTPGGTA